MQQKTEKTEKTEKRKFYSILSWLFVGIVIAAVSIFILTSLFFKNLRRPVSGSLPDDVVSTTFPDGNHLINDRTGGYSFILPISWFFEKKDGSGIAVYPDYDPRNNVTPKCKIEISVFKNIAATKMNDWVTSHIHEDPTIVVSETFRNVFSVPGATSAFDWNGTMDGIVTTIAYISANGNIYEIVPSVLDIKKADGNDICDVGFKSFLNGISFRNDAKQ